MADAGNRDAELRHVESGGHVFASQGAIPPDGCFDNAQYVEDLKSFAKKVGLRKTAPSAVLDALAPALKQLAGELEVPMRDGSMEIHRFLEEWKVDEASGNIIFRFFRENQRPRQQPAKNEFVAAIERIRAGARK